MPKRSNEQNVIDLFGKSVRPILEDAQRDKEPAHIILLRCHEGGTQIQIATLGTFSNSDICEAMRGYIRANINEGDRHGKDN